MQVVTTFYVTPNVLLARVTWYREGYCPPGQKTFEELSKIPAPGAEIVEEFRLPDPMSKWKAEGRRNVPKSFDDLTPFPNGWFTEAPVQGLRTAAEDGESSQLSRSNR